MRYLKPLLLVIFIFLNCSATAQYMPAGYQDYLEKSRPENKSNFAEIFSDKIFVSATQAFEAYVGNWIGGQSLYVEDNQVAETQIEQHFVISRDGKKIVATGKITSGGQSVPIRSYMYVNGDKLLLDIQTIDGRIVQYLGFLDFNAVIWVPKYFFMAYDFQRDSFYKTKNGTRMITEGLRYVNVPQRNFSGYLRLYSVVECQNASKPMKDISSSKSSSFAFPKSKSGIRE